MDLFGDERLYENPDLVETDDKMAWATAFWFWKKNVRNDKNVKLGYFGASTKLIHGALECQGSNTNTAKSRFDKYKFVLKAFKIDEVANEKGCYPL